jgi:biopolymer transport protein TolR
MAGEIPQDKQTSAISNINVTPFVDVMLVLLVIFMVTAPIIQEGVEVNLPQAKAKPVEGEDQPLIVTIARDNQIYLNDNPMTLEELETKLRAITQLDRQKGVYLRADRDVRYGTVIEAIGEIKAAGIQKLGMIALPAPEP